MKRGGFERKSVSLAILLVNIEADKRRAAKTEGEKCEEHKMRDWGEHFREKISLTEGRGASCLSRCIGVIK